MFLIGKKEKEIIFDIKYTLQKRQMHVILGKYNVTSDEECSILFRLTYDFKKLSLSFGFLETNIFFDLNKHDKNKIYLF